MKLIHNLYTRVGYYNYYDDDDYYTGCMPHSASLSTISSARKTYGFKLVGDNLDINIKSRFMRMEGSGNKSLHFFHSYAVLNKVDFSNLPDFHLPTCLNSPKKRALSLLPSADDDRLLRQDFMVLISRILVTHLPFFKWTADDAVEWHIRHKFYEEMSSKSVVVCGYCLDLTGNDLIYIL